MEETFVKISTSNASRPQFASTIPISASERMKLPMLVQDVQDKLDAVVEDADAEADAEETKTQLK
jgi:hypothetical protein